MEIKNKRIEKIVTLIVVGISGGVMYTIPYLRETYYKPLQEATGATNTQLGLLMSAYAIVNFICYFPGGILADKFSAKKLIILSCVASAAMGFWYSTLPGFASLVVIHAVMAITTVLTFWCAMMKVVNCLGDEDEQGKLFGSLEGIRGLSRTIIAFGSVFVFSRMAGSIAGLRGIIFYYSVVLLVTGILVAIFVPDTKKLVAQATARQEAKKASVPKTDSGTDEKSGGLKWTEMFNVLKIPRVWLCGALVVFNYSALIFHGYITPYMSVAFGVSDSTAAALSIIRTYVMMCVGAFAAGLIADKMKSCIKFMQFGFAGMTIFSIVYLLIPANHNALWLIVTNFVIYGMCLYSVKALYFSTIDEVLIPKKLAGTAAGVISLLGYAPEIFLYTLSGSIVDNNEGLLGYRYCFTAMVILAAAGFACAILLRTLNNKAIAKAKLAPAS